MKFNKKFQKKGKKLNISLRRKLFTFYFRIIFFFKISFLILLYLLIFTKYLSSFREEIKILSLKTTATLGFKFENIIIEGQNNCAKNDILNSLKVKKNAPIFSIDLNNIKEKLEQNPWIKIAAVQRILPNTIYIAIIERVPLAIWQVNQKLYLIDEQGVKITSQIEKYIKLLHVVGEDANIYASKLINDLQNHPEFFSKVISAVRYGNRRWNLNLVQNIIIKMPEHNFEDALAYLLELNRAEKLFNQNYKTIDLRNFNKIYFEKF